MLLQPHLSASGQGLKIPDANRRWSGEGSDEHGGDEAHNGDDAISSGKHPGLHGEQNINLTEAHTQNCSFSCGTLFRTQTNSQGEQSMKGHRKLGNALAGVDSSLPFVWRFEKTLASNQGNLLIPTWMDLPYLRVKKKNTNMWTFEKKLLRNKAMELLLESSEEEHPSQNSGRTQN